MCTFLVRFWYVFVRFCTILVRFWYSRAAALAHLLVQPVRFWYVFGTFLVRFWYSSGAALAQHRRSLGTRLVRFRYVFGTLRCTLGTSLVQPRKSPFNTIPIQSQFNCRYSQSCCVRFNDAHGRKDANGRNEKRTRANGRNEN